MGLRSLQGPALLPGLGPDSYLQQYWKEFFLTLGFKESEEDWWEIIDNLPSSHMSHLELCRLIRMK